ncbi:peptidoglycan/xylan/chitin deacetylase (PgdA/CDA1 family) [Methylobacterium sp. BE186]|uniref:polysaccharide deacetylase family protein n=1 Tax=Methylobacterium sp. BE186 TaxID=2817715 RepID=UPI002866ABC9|nr:polysaccharide deacetylase family protein [Methylobacterium sp. BE186]MDR7037301.1 peptidoglycan/xylan/chitin deacetylase (PgdA/CDA1 family) [Methylobacterium sp. BE186]
MLSSRNRRRLFEAGFRVVSGLGADRWLEPAARGQGLILTFHHVSPELPDPFAPNRLLSITPDFLDETLTALRERGFTLVPLDAVPDHLARRPGARFAALTFDDGYRDNALHAAPVLARHRAPWTLFVTSDFADGRGRLWWIELERAIRRLDRVAVTFGTGKRLDLPARDAAQKSVAFEAVYRALRAGPEERLLSAIAELCERAGFGAGSIAAELCLGWDELRDLARDPAVDIGAHTRSHPMLAKHAVEVARAEIAGGRARIERAVGRRVRHLSYPVGDRTSAGPREFALARELGFVTAVTTRPGHLFPEHADHLHALPRISVNGCHQSRAALKGLLSGVPFLVWNRGRRLDVA